MRSSLKVGVGLCALAGAVSYSATANTELYFNHYTDGSWTNAEYNDGNCHYYYSHNAYDGATNVNRYGDCSRIAIGPNGEAVQLMAVPFAAAPY